MGENESNENRKVDEPQKFVLDVEHIWMLWETEVVEVRYAYPTVYVHIAGEMI